MMRYIALTILSCFIGASSIAAQTVDLLPDSSTVGTAVSGKPLTVTVHISNNSLNAYTAGSVHMTVDIDQPSKPGVPGISGSCTGSFTGSVVIPTIPASGSVPVSVPVSFLCFGSNARITATVAVEGGFVDSDNANNTRVDVIALSSAVPATNWLLLTALAVFLLVASTFWRRIRS